jgi:hypothetical protein
LRDFFKLTPFWNSKTDKQWLQWAIDNGITPEQIKAAADLWGKDKRFNWQHPNLKGIAEHWLELIESTLETTVQAITDQPDQDWRKGLNV